MPTATATATATVTAMATVVARAWRAVARRVGESDAAKVRSGDAVRLFRGGARDDRQKQPTNTRAEPGRKPVRTFFRARWQNFCYGALNFLPRRTPLAWGLDNPHLVNEKVDSISAYAGTRQYMSSRPNTSMCLVDHFR